MLFLLSARDDKNVQY